MYGIMNDYKVLLVAFVINSHHWETDNQLQELIWSNWPIKAASLLSS